MKIINYEIIQMDGLIIFVVTIILNSILNISLNKFSMSGTVLNEDNDSVFWNLLDFLNW